MIASPEYNFSVPPAISNTLDYFYHSEFYLKPAAIASYSMGTFGGVRASVALLPLLHVQNALAEDGEVSAATSYPKIRENFAGFANELIWAAKVLKEGKKAESAN
ncbi:hypothetical protein BDR26DRAFT_853689 [Obelidium mucronatum]|nr:hypothetical protein BDR26DRAFT_853689 [Obelidium mucronatum]